MTKMKFNQTVFYESPDIPAYTAGQIAEVEDHMVMRWLKRGAEIIDEALVGEEDQELDSEMQEDIELGEDKKEDIPRRKYKKRNR